MQGLISSKDAEIHSRILTKLEQDPELTVQTVAEERQRILNLRIDTAKIEERDILQVQTVRRKGKKKWGGLRRTRVMVVKDFISRQIAHSKIVFPM